MTATPAVMSKSTDSPNRPRWTAQHQGRAPRRLRPAPKHLRRDERYVLNPWWVFRREQRRILLYEMDSDAKTAGASFVFLGPVQAITLALFDGRRTFAEVEEALAFLLKLKPSRVRARLRDILAELREGRPGLLVHADKTVLPYVSSWDPLDLIVPADDVELNGGDLRLDAPVDLNLLLNIQCNRRCVYCYADSETKEPKLLPTARLKEIISEAVELGVTSIFFGGGDPMLHPDVVELAAHVLSCGVEPYISTKQFISQERADALARAGLSHIQLSIDTLDPGLADRMVGAHNYVAMMLASIDHLQRAGIRVRAKAVLTSLNADGVAGHLEGLYQLGIRMFRFDEYGRSVFRHADALYLTDEQVVRAQKAIEDFSRRHPRCWVSGSPSIYVKPSAEQQASFWPQRAYCSTARTGISLLPDGRVIVCDRSPVADEFILGDLSRMSVREYWESERIRAFLLPPRETLQEPCRSCEEYEACHLRGRCVKDVYEVYERADAADPKCPKAGVNERL